MLLRRWALPTLLLKLKPLQEKQVEIYRPQKNVEFLDMPVT